MTLESFKEGLGNLWEDLAEGWRYLTRSAAGALTRFRPGAATKLPSQADVDDAFYMPTRSWAILGGDLFEDKNDLVVRLELPGMEKEDIDIEVSGDSLVISGEKRFEEESTEGRWRVMQCAYGAFRRVVPLPVPVLADKANATYKNGVLKLKLPKAAPGEPKTVTVNVD